MSDYSFNSLLSQYPILLILAENISALDLFHLSLASKTIHSFVQPNKSIFSALTRESLCDGHGLIARQELKGPYNFVTPYRYVWGKERKIHHDEPIEVNLWAQKCDEANALPCLKCGVNVCEECRYLDRVALRAGELYRKPFPHPNWEHDNFIGLCPDCDSKTQKQISGKYLYEDCVCDVWNRWVCFKCYCEEEKANRRYMREHTALADDYYYSDENADDEKRPRKPETKVIGIHQAALEVWCFCGAPVLQETRLRCAWCQRRLPSEEEWGVAADAIEQVQREKQYLDPTYPPWSEPYQRGEYPKLPYEGPIWMQEEWRRHVDSLQQEQHHQQCVRTCQ